MLNTAYKLNILNGLYHGAKISVEMLSKIAFMNSVKFLKQNTPQAYVQHYCKFTTFDKIPLS